MSNCYGDWITGRANSGKTTLAKRISNQTGGIVIDGDEIRELFPTGFSDEERFDHIIRIAKFASLLEKQGYTVIVACISPKIEWRKEARRYFKESLEICLPFGNLWEGTEFEEPLS